MSAAIFRKDGTAQGVAKSQLIESLANPINASFMIPMRTLMEGTTLVDLNSEYFAPIGRKLPDNEIFNLEHHRELEEKSLLQSLTCNKIRFSQKILIIMFHYYLTDL